jgi:preprotein translocase subunit SecF
MLFEKFEKHWKIWMWIPIALLLLSSCLIVFNIATTGSFMKRDVELIGGKSVTFEVSDFNLNAIKAALPYATVRTTSGVIKNIIVDIPLDRDESEIISVVEANAKVSGLPTIQTTGPSIGNIFFQQAQMAFILAFIFMAITVFILFRSPVPSSIVVLCAATDIIVTIGVLIILDVSLSLPVIAALITLIGYSVDTDLVLTSELLRGQHHEIRDGIKRAMKTGMTLTLTTLVALVAMYFVSGSLIIEQIAFVLIIGLLVDLPATWLANTGILRFWLEKKRRVQV